MSTRTQLGVWAVVVAASLGVHAVAFGGLGRGGWGRDAGVTKRKPATVDFSVNPPKSPPPVAPKAEPKSRLAMARPAPKAAPATPPPPSVAPPPPAESPADFTGQTLTNDGPNVADGWASATGNGEKMNGPVGRPGSKVTRRVVDTEDKGSKGPRVVGLADLSHAPGPPDLVGALEAAYPADARAKGLAGKAVVRARIMPDGNVRELALVSESGTGFGTACEKTLRGSHWTAPLDKNGETVSTFISYICRFEVE